MATATDTTRNGAAEAASAVQDAVLRYLDESTAIGRAYWTALSGTAQAGMRTTFDLQNTSMQASRTMLEAAAQANRNWWENTAESMRKSQDATTKLAAASASLLESMMPVNRG